MEVCILKTLEQEVEARECASATRQPVPFRKPPVRTPTSNFLIGNSSTPSCVYCGGNKNHTHNSCTAISDVEMPAKNTYARLEDVISA